MRELKILIVEDSESKLISITNLINKLYPNSEIVNAFSVKSAIDRLAEFHPAVIVVDMSLPTYDIKSKERGGTPRPFGGIEIFETIEYLGVTIPVIVATSYPILTDGEQSVGLHELSEQLQADFNNIYIGTVYFDSAYTTWEEKMTTYLNQVLGGDHDD